MASGVKHYADGVLVSSYEDITITDDLSVGDDLTVADDLIMTSGNAITTASNADLKLVPNGTGIVQIGDAGSTSHSLAANDDLFVSGKFEVDGVSSFDGRLDSYSGIRIHDGQALRLGGGDDVSFYYSGARLYLGVSPENVLHINEKDDNGTNWGTSSQTNPTLMIHSADAADTTGWISFAHDQTDGVIATGKGMLKIVPTGITQIGDAGSTANGLADNDDLLVTGKLENLGNTYLNNNVYLGAAKTITFSGKGAIGTQSGSELNLALVSSQHSFSFISYDNRLKDHDEPATTDPTIYVYSATDPDSDNTQYTARTHNQTDALDTIGKGGYVCNHGAPVALADEAEFALPNASSGFGFFQAGDGEEYGLVSWTSAGVVTEISGSANFNTADADGDFCVYDGGTNVNVKNRLGAEKEIMFWYHYTT